MSKTPEPPADDSWARLIRSLNEPGGSRRFRHPPARTVSLLPSEVRRPAGFGDPLEFPKASPYEKRRIPANPYIWGAWGAIGCGIAGTFISLNGQMQPSQTIFGFAMGGFFWIALCARIWNWLGRKL